MFQFLADWWNKIAEFFISVFDFIISIPAQLISWIVEFFQWFYKTMFNLVVNFAFDTIESVSTQFNPDFTLDRNLLLEYLAKSIAGSLSIWRLPMVLFCFKLGWPSRFSFLLVISLLCGFFLQKF